MTGLDVDPDLLPNSRGCADNFHMACSVEKKLLICLKEMLLKQPDYVQDEFQKKLLDFLQPAEVMIWKLDKPVNTYLGLELKTFTQKGSLIAAWAQEISLVSNKDTKWTALCKALKLWADCYKFLVKAKVEEGNDYEEEIKTYEKNMIELYRCGAKTFFKKNGTVGPGETVYFHMLLCQVPYWARKTYARHGVGIGVFTLQGMERRNKETKHEFKKHTNCKGNLCKQTMKKTVDVYEEIRQKK